MTLFSFIHTVYKIIISCLSVKGSDLHEVKNRVAFGSSQDRQLYHRERIPNRTGCEEPPIRGFSHIGPGTYRNEKFTSLSYTMDKKPTSIKGYSMGARTAPRFPPFKKTFAPSPATYQPLLPRIRKWPKSFMFSTGIPSLPVIVKDVETKPKKDAGSPRYFVEVNLRKKESSSTSSEDLDSD